MSLITRDFESFEKREKEEFCSRFTQLRVNNAQIGEEVKSPATFTKWETESSSDPIQHLNEVHFVSCAVPNVLCSEEEQNTKKDSNKIYYKSCSLRNTLEIFDKSFLIDTLSNSRNYIKKRPSNPNEEEVAKKFQEASGASLCLIKEPKTITCPNYSYYTINHRNDVQSQSPNHNKLTNFYESSEQEKVKFQETKQQKISKEEFFNLNLPLYENDFEFESVIGFSARNNHFCESLSCGDPNFKANTNNMNFVNQVNFQRIGGSKLEVNMANATYLLDIYLKAKMGCSTFISEANHTNLKGHYFKIFTTQEYCKMMQKFIPATSPFILANILDEISECLKVLMVDQYANYLIPIFYKYLNFHSRLIFLKKLVQRADLTLLAKNTHGTFSLQKIIDVVSSNEEAVILIEAFEQDFVETALDSKGVHVLVKMFALFPEALTKGMYKTAIANIMKLSYDPNGMAISLYIITHVSEMNLLGLVYNALSHNALYLVQHTYGNYSIQTGIDTWGKAFALVVFDQIKHNIRSFTKQKTASRVLEKCLRYGGNEIASVLIDKICISRSIVDIMKNKYGNYVLQTAVNLSKGENKLILLDSLQKDLDLIGNGGIRDKWAGIIRNGYLELKSGF